MSTRNKEAIGNEHVCTIGHLKFVDNFLRKMVHNPKKLFGQYIKEGMTVLDIGCGGGFVTLGFADMVGSRGKVIAADLQMEMLKITMNKSEKAGVTDRIIFHQCKPDRIGYESEIDFALAFFMVHETPDIPGLLEEVYNILKDGRLFFISEPTFHVSKNEFAYTLEEAVKIGYKIHSYPKVMLGRNVILQK
jgi:ubiquinone/menaquinone biosynthesis C-methylase UbiE